MTIEFHPSFRRAFGPAAVFQFYYDADVAGCWEWKGGRSGNGYGMFYLGYVNRKTAQVLAHRFQYERLVGPIPPNMTIDHLCRNRACVNPSHMEVVTNRENILRGECVSAVNA